MADLINDLEYTYIWRINGKMYIAQNLELAVEVYAALRKSDDLDETGDSRDRAEYTRDIKTAMCLGYATQITTAVILP